MTTTDGLLRAVGDSARSSDPAAGVADPAGALGHAGRALAHLADYGVDPGPGFGQRNRRAVTDLSGACSVIPQRIWPASGGALTNQMGVAADILSSHASVVGAPARWAAAVAVAQAAEHCAEHLQRCYPDVDHTELVAVLTATSAVRERARQQPPTAAGAATWDRLLPDPSHQPAAGRDAIARAAGQLRAAVAAANERPTGLTLREFRTVTAAAELTSRHAIAADALFVEVDGHEPWRATALTWNVVGRSTNPFNDLRRGPDQPSPVASCAEQLADNLLSNYGTGAPSDQPSIHATYGPEDLHALRRIANQLPLIAEELTTSVESWPAHSVLTSDLRRVPQAENLTVRQIEALTQGHPHVLAEHWHLRPLREAIAGARDLSTALADDLNRLPRSGPLEQPHLARLYTERTAGPANHTRLLDRAQRAAEAHKALAGRRGRDRSVPR